MEGYMAEKGQAAMEFLMNYGMVIVISLIVIGALVYFDILSPAQLGPEKCVLATGSGLLCDDFRVNAEGVILRLKNAVTTVVFVEAIETVDPVCSYFGGQNIEKNSYADFSLKCLLTANQKVRTPLSIQYKKGPGGLPRSAKGELLLKVSQSTTVNETICQNGEDGGLCEGLDILFGSGYRDLCCSQYTLCCQ